MYYIFSVFSIPIITLFQISYGYVHYSNTDSGVFKGGIKVIDTKYRVSHSEVYKVNQL